MLTIFTCFVSYVLGALTVLTVKWWGPRVKDKIKEFLKDLVREVVSEKKDA